MTITLGWWVLPMALTAFMWGLTMRPRGYVSQWDFAGALEMIGALIGSLAVWLAYFVWLALT